MQFDFFATDDDLLTVWRLIYNVPDMKIFESYSKPDQTNQWIGGWDEFVAIYEEYKGFAAWPVIVGGEPRARWVEFEPNTQIKLGSKGRTVLESPAIIDVMSLGVRGSCLASSCIKCWNEKGARQRSSFPEEFCDEVDWRQFRSKFAKIQRQIIKMCPAKLRQVPIMPDAFDKFRDGQIKLWNWGEECEFPSDFVSII